MGQFMRKDNIMKQRKLNKGRLAVSLLAACFLATQSLQANATDITGVTGNNGIYNINPTDQHNGVGFRQYENFNLSEGDIANLIFKYGNENVSKFVNLVDNQVNINGLVNSMRDGKFYNGQAIFISPKGMVVGASGVINVGSLSVLTPTQSDYEKYKNSPDLGYFRLDQNNADVTINGKVITREGIELSGRNVIVGANAGMITGIQNNDVINTNNQANILFNNLVNTSVSNANTFAAENGKIVIKTYADQGGTQINGTVKNFADNGKINIGNKGADGLKIAGTVETNGDTLLVNHNGDLEISGNVKSDFGAWFKERFPETIPHDAQEQPLKRGGFGGIASITGYILPEITFLLEETPFTLYQVEIVKEANNNLASGSLGTDFLQAFKQITINYDKMFVRVTTK